MKNLVLLKDHLKLFFDFLLENNYQNRKKANHKLINSKKLELLGNNQNGKFQNKFHIHTSNYQHYCFSYQYVLHNACTLK